MYLMINEHFKEYRVTIRIFIIRTHFHVYMLQN